MAKFTRNQWLTLIVIGIADFCNAICVSLQAPFYPAEAQKKGCTATEYGLVFGIFEFVVFLISPFYGHHLNKIGLKFTFNGGIYTTGVCAILFGFLDRIEGRYTFITLSFVIRIIEAMGNAAFLTASFAIIAKEFPDNVATTFASLETFFGLGLIVGPTVGGALYQISGYTLPFVVMGSALFASAILTAFVLPKYECGTDKEKGRSMVGILRIPHVLLASASIMVTSMSIGFLQATLAAHLSVFELAPVVLGLMFVINGGVYAVSAPGFGWVSDHLINPKIVIILGTVLVSTGFCLIGPAPFIPYPTTMWMTIVGLILHGFGMSAQLVASFGEALRSSIAHGFPNNLETYGIVSGLWTSTFALGAFIGPSISGILYDAIGFRNASMFISGIHVVVGFLMIMFVVFYKPRAKYVYVEVRDTSASYEDPTMMGDGAEANGHILFSKPQNIEHKNLQPMGNGISIERSRPPAMNSLIACNSYKSQAWSEKDTPSVPNLPLRNRNRKNNDYGSLAS